MQAAAPFAEKLAANATAEAHVRGTHRRLNMMLLTEPILLETMMLNDITYHHISVYISKKQKKRHLKSVSFFFVLQVLQCLELLCKKIALSANDLSTDQLVRTSATRNFGVSRSKSQGCSSACMCRWKPSKKMLSSQLFLKSRLLIIMGYLGMFNYV